MYKRLAYETDHAPCIDCDDRVKPTKENPHRCHDSCVRYRAWRENYETKRNMIKNAHKENHTYDRVVMLDRAKKFSNDRHAKFSKGKHR